MRKKRHEQKVTAHARKRLVVKAGAKPADILNQYKDFLEVEEKRLQMAHRRGASGRSVAEGRAQMLDILLQHVLRGADRHYCEQHQDQPGKGPAALALLAIGGYGRGELSPLSDVDIMFLHSQSGRAAQHPYLESIVEQVLYMLWDIGLKVGHSTRSISEATAQANEDMQSKTSLIESRLIIGDQQLYDAFTRALLKNCVQGQEDKYIQARIEDQEERHQKFGDAVYMQEPNIKNGCGGLRDFHNLLWMAFFKYRVQTLPDLRNKGYLHRDEQRDLEAAYEFLLRTRNELHYLTNRPGDTIHLGLQPKIATALKYRQRDVLRRMEAFMRDYYMHARNIFLITNALAERMALTPQRVSALQKLLGRSRRRKPEEWDGFIVERGVISPATARTFKDEPLRILRVFLHTQRQHLEFSPDLRTRLRQDLDLVDRSFRTSREARDMFFEILRRKGQVARILRLMHETGVLGQYLPEFGKLTCLVQHEFFHRYTADEHTLQVIDHLDRVLDATQPPHSNYRKLFQEAEHPGILYLALLLHDVGKAANAERHAEASVEGARKVATRLHLDQDETERLLFLVRDHLKLSLLSQRRDIDDQATIAAAARVVKNPANLDLLQLLTFADAAGTSLKGWSDWKEALLWELYHRTRQALTGPERARNILAKRIEQLYQEVSTKLKNKLPLEEIYSHFELMSASYYINTSATLIINHLNLIHEFITRQQEVEKAEDSLAPVIEWRSQESQGFSQVDICTWDRLGLFSKICASFAVAGLNILRARVYTRGDHVVLDVFEVCDRDHQAVHDPKAIQTAESMLTRILTLQQEVNYDKITERLRARRRSQSRLQEMTIPTVIQFDNEISESRTVIEVQAEDQVGLLYTLTDTMSDLGLDISIAKIATEKGAAFDSFYVMDHFTGKVTDKERLDHIRRRLEDAIAALSRQD